MVNTILLNTLSGTTEVVSTRSLPTVGALRQEAADRSGVPCNFLRLVSNAIELSDDTVPLAEVVGEQSNVYCLARLLGGGKKRKKKTYTKPKKIKHKKRKEKMAVLKYYKVTDDMKIQRLRKECPSETCGAGIFMAAHPDRFYCGKCTLTYVQEGKE